MLWSLDCGYACGRRSTCTATCQALDRNDTSGGVVWYTPRRRYVEDAAPIRPKRKPRKHWELRNKAPVYVQRNDKAPQLMFTGRVWKYWRAA